MKKTNRSTYVDKNEVLNFVEANAVKYSFGISKRFRQHYASIRDAWRKGMTVKALHERLEPFDVMRET